jgi:hypothetical protein
VWKLRGHPCRARDGYWFAKQAQRLAMGLAGADVEVAVHLVWTYAERRAHQRLDGGSEYAFAHSVRRALHSTTLYGGLRERSPEDTFEDWDRETRSVVYRLHSKGKPGQGEKSVRVQVLATRDAVRLGLLPAARPVESDSEEAPRRLGASSSVT